MKQSVQKDKKALERYRKLVRQIQEQTEINLFETPEEQKARIKRKLGNNTVKLICLWSVCLYKWDTVPSFLHYLVIYHFQSIIPELRFKVKIDMHS
jgi:hypothetical protein